MTGSVEGERERGNNFIIDPDLGGHTPPDKELSRENVRGRE